MTRSDPRGMEGMARYGRLQAAPVADVPYLPDLPYLCPHVRERAPAHIRARVRNHIYVWKVWKVWKVWNRAGFIGLQGSIPWLEVWKVWKGGSPC